MAVLWLIAWLQVIDLPQGKLNNVIEFPPAGAFVVDSSLSVAGPQRLEFAFNGATLRTDRRTFTLPPFGKGWCVSAALCGPISHLLCMAALAQRQLMLSGCSWLTSVAWAGLTPCTLMIN